MAAWQAQKLPIVRSLNAFAAQKVLTKIRETGRSLPCSVVSVAGAIVTVKFEVSSGFTLPRITIPVHTSIYVREPIQVGDKGYCVAADAYLGGMSGLGGGVADLTLRGNLTPLAFQPLGNNAWPAVDPNAVVIGQGAPNGVVLRDASDATTVVLTPGSLILQSGGKASLDLTDVGNVTLNGTLTTTIEAGQTLTLLSAGQTIELNSAGIFFNGAPYVPIGPGSIATGIVGGATPTPLTANTNIISSAPPGTGFILSGTTATGNVIIQNDDATNNALIYPPAGAQINALGTNAPFSMGSLGSRITFSTNSPTTQWWAG